MNILLQQLEQHIARYGRGVVAFSAGVDSSVVAAAAHAALGDRVLIVTAATETITAEDLQLARSMARERGWHHEEISYSELEIPGYAPNPTNRCYFCKDTLYSRLAEIARARGFDTVFDGANADDVGDYRPGRKAAAEQGVVSPLLDLGINKASVRELAQLYGLPNHDRPSAPCLSSRVPYGTAIDRAMLERIGNAERSLRELGFTELRVRHHGDVARVELPRGDFPHAVELAAEIDRRLQVCGYRYVALDLRGFRSGALNEVLVVAQSTPSTAD